MIIVMKLLLKWIVMIMNDNIEIINDNDINDDDDDEWMKMIILMK